MAVPPAAGSTIYLGPGAYRETNVVPSGSLGNVTTIIGDVTGENTDGVGGLIRLTGTDNDQSPTRSSCLTGSSKGYFAIKGICFDGTTSGGNPLIYMSSANNCTFEDCVFQSADYDLYFDGASQANITVRRCIFFPVRSDNIIFEHSATLNNVGHVVENCLFWNANSTCIRIKAVGGGTIRNCNFAGIWGVRVSTALAAGQSWAVNNNIFNGCNVACEATASGEIVENYNCFNQCATLRTNTATGANSNTYIPLFQPPILLSGGIYTWIFGALSPYSQLGAIAGSSPATLDLYGTTRVATSSWGAVQYEAVRRPKDAGESRGRRGNYQ